MAVSASISSQGMCSEDTWNLESCEIARMKDDESKECPHPHCLRLKLKLAPGRMFQGTRVPLTSLGISAPCPLDGTAPAMRPNFWKNSWRAPYLFPGVHVQCLGFQYLHESTWCFYIHDKIKDASATYYAWLIGSGVFTYLPRAAVSALEQSAQGSSSKPNLPMILTEEISPLLS